MKNIIRPTSLLLLLLFFTGAAFADITSLTIREKAGATTANYPLTFGHVFKQGDVTQGVAVSVNGQLLQTQFDIKRRYADNSVRHGVISVVLPMVEAGQDLELTLVAADENSSAGAMSKAAILAKGVQSRIHLTGLSGSGYSGEVTASLHQAIDASVDLDYWLSGPIATEVLLNQKLNSSLNAAWEARFYSGWDGIRISNAMENVEGDYRGNVNYAVDIQMGDNDNPLASHYSKSAFQHNHNARWRKVLWIGQEPPEVEIRYNAQYIIDSKHILNYDTSVSVSESVINNCYSEWQATDHDIMGTGYIQTYFPTTGGREEIGHLPTWTVRYLLSMDNRLKEIMLNHAEMASGIPIHYRESDPAESFYGHIISIDDRPTVWFGREDFHYQEDEDKLPESIGDETTVWHVDRAHQTSFAYIPYMVTGERYYLDELYYWSGYNLGASNFSYRERETGLIVDQVRGEAWGIRVLAQAASIAPDTDIENDYLNQKVQNNIDAWIAKINTPDHHPLHTWGDISCWGEDGGRQTGSIIGCEGTADRTGTGSGTNEDVYPVRHTSLPWQDDWMVISLCHMKELGYDTQEILTWLGEYTINRFSHPDASWFNGADYKIPSTYSEHVGTATPYFNIPNWKQASDSFTAKSTEFVEDNPANYPREAYAALSCITDVTVEQTSYDGSINQTMSGQRVYDWMSDQFGNNSVWNDDPTWAIIPRAAVESECGNGICDSGESNDSCPDDCTSGDNGSGDPGDNNGDSDTSGNGSDCFINSLAKTRY
jgi:hypothetical protein